MTRCTKTIEELSAYMDGEVTLEEELALRRHLDGCPTCQQMISLFATLKDTVTRATEVYPLPHTLRVVLKERPQPPRWSLFSWTLFLKGGLIAALLFLTFAVGAGLIGERRIESPANLLAQTLVSHHRTTPSGPDELGISSEDPTAITAWFHTQLPFPVRVSTLAEAHLLGGQICTLWGAP